jgi:hypothetical protein
MRSRTSFRPFFTVLFLALLACQKEDVKVEAPGPDPYTGLSHPRLLLLEGEEEAIKMNIANDPVWEKMHEAILAECDKIIRQSPVEREMTGRRLLSVSRNCLKRVFFLSYAYRMTGYEKYLRRAETEMTAAASFSDWNPSHFLDVAEMTMALAIGYDWLYEDLKEDSRTAIRDAIVNKGITPSYDGTYNWFLGATHNWNQVCNAGMTFGALAVAESHPDLAKKTIDRAVASIPLAMEEYQPHGAYPEGYGYWGYGTTTNVMFLSAIETAFKTDYGLTATPGFLQTAEFRQQMTGATSLCFNWGDNGLGGSLSPAMFWFAQKSNDPSLLWVERQYLDRDNYSSFTGERLLPALMIWGKDLPLESVPEPTTKVWIGQGANPVALMRASWTDPNAVYLGFKAGSPSVNHGHMDIGSFVMEAGGVRWASDLGVQNYESLESKGIQVFGKGQDAQRWTIFRMNNYCHNTLTVDGKLQRVNGYAKIDRYSDDPAFTFAISDISSVYNGQLESAVRGAAIVDKQYVVIRDELKALDSPTTVRWNILTEADVALEDQQAILTKDGRKLYLQVSGPANLQMKTWSTEPTTDYDAPNPGTILVGFECELPANGAAVLQVMLVPETAGAVSGLALALGDW